MEPPSQPPSFVPLRDGIADLQARVVIRAGQLTRLTPLEASLLAYLAQFPGQAVPRERLLTAVWGYRPGVASRTVDTTLRRLRLKVEVDPSSPAILITLPGEGVRLVQVTDSDESLRSRGAPGPFIGRSEALARIDRVVEHGSRWIAVVGPGGVGKTRLVRRWCRDRAARIVELAPCRSVGQVLPTVAAAVGPLPDSDIETVASRLNYEGVWLVLDNLEHLLPGASSVLAQLLVRAPHLRILMTSQRRAEVPGEAVVELSPLAEADAVTLLRELAPADLARVSEAALVRLSARVGRLPLALELAAARAAVLGVDPFLSDDAPLLDLLGHPSRTGRHASIRATLEWSWSQLTDANRDALHSLTVFQGGFESSEAQFVLGGARPLDELHQLRAACWLTLQPIGSGPARFDLLEPMRAFVLDRHGPPPAQAVERHGSCFASMAEAGRRQRLDHADGHERLRNRASWWNLHAAAGNAEASGHLDVAAWCVVGLFDAAKAHRSLAPLVPMMSRILRSPALAPDARATLCYALGDCYRLSGVPGDARVWAVQARDLARAHGLPLLECDTERLLGILALTAADEAAANEHYEAAERLALQTGSLRAQSTTANTRGNLALRGGRIDEAEAYYRAAIADARCIDSRRLVALAEANLAIALHEKGDLHGAAQAYEGALEGALSVGDQRQVAMTRGNQGALSADRGDVSEARAGYLESIELCREVGAGRPLVITLMGLAELERRVGNSAAALECIHEAKRELPADRYPVIHWIVDAIDAELGPPSQTALDTLASCEQKLAERGIPIESALVACRLGRVAVGLDQGGLAQAALERARRLDREGLPDLKFHISDLQRVIEAAGSDWPT